MSGTEQCVRPNPLSESKGNGKGFLSLSPAKIKEFYKLQLDVGAFPPISSLSDVHPVDCKGKCVREGNQALF